MDTLRKQRAETFALCRKMETLQKEAVVDKNEAEVRIVKEY
jgi:hypothetical protein